MGCGGQRARHPPVISAAPPAVHAPPSMATIGPGIIAAESRAHGGGGEGGKVSCGSLLSSDAVKTQMPGAGGRRGGVWETKHHLCPKSSDCQAAQTADASWTFPSGRCQVHTPHKGKEAEAQFRTRTRGPDTRVSLSTSGWRAAGRAGGHHVAVAGVQAALGL